MQDAKNDCKDSPTRMLIVDDEQSFLDALSKVFRRRNVLVQTASSGSEAWDILQHTSFDIVLSDLAMPDMSGVELLKKLRSEDNLVPLIIMTGVGSIESAVEAVQFGAYNYITKPVKIHILEELVTQAVEYGRMRRQLEQQAEGGFEKKQGLPMVLGASKALQETLETIERIATTSVPLLICGETGTGKSLLAKHIHKSGSRAHLPFMTIDCGALPETLLESELFGHTKGAFTGAHSDRRGLLEEGQGGTVFLDEIGELTPTMQVKLLRVIQEKEIRPIGGNKSVPIDVQFITASNRNLIEEVEKGIFREDLYYRLAVITLKLPPLRERKEDIVAFVAHFVQKFNVRHGKNITDVEPAALQLLMQQAWRGNVRELENVIERAVLLTKETTISPGSLALKNELPLLPSSAKAIALQQAVEETERKTIAQALLVTNGNRTRAAEILGIGRRTLYSKLEEYGLLP